ncbi:hypothetical protein ACLB2K_073258 [Fragaria x ananassa]
MEKTTVNRKRPAQRSETGGRRRRRFLGREIVQLGGKESGERVWAVFSSCIDEETPATVTNVAENIPQHVADYCVSSDDSNYEDNMINGNFLCTCAIEKGFLFDYAKNDNFKVGANCSKKESYGCEWHQKHMKLGSKVISSNIVDKVKSNPLIKPKDIVKHFKEDYELLIPYHMAYRGKDYANHLLNGSEALGSFSTIVHKLWRLPKGFPILSTNVVFGRDITKNKHKGVMLSTCAKTGNKDEYDQVAIKCHGSEAVTNFNPSLYDGEIEAEAATSTRGFHSTGVKRMGGHGHDEPFYMHSKHMYNLDLMKHQALKMSLGVFTAFSIGVGVPVFAVIFQQKKTASG